MAKKTRIKKPTREEIERDPEWQGVAAWVEETDLPYDEAWREAAKEIFARLVQEIRLTAAWRAYGETWQALYSGEAAPRPREKEPSRRIPALPSRPTESCGSKRPALRLVRDSDR